MAETEKPNLNFNPSETKDKYAGLKDLSEHITTVARVVLWSFFTVITYISFKDEVTLWKWHPFLMVFGYVLITSEGILIVRRDTVFTKHLSHRTRLTIHWLIQILAIVVPVTGFVIMIVYKNQNGWEHLKSPHALIGLNGVITSILASTGGISALYNLGLTRYIKPYVLKFIHGGSGLIAYASAAIAITLKLADDRWLEENLSRQQRIVLGVTMFAAMLWVAARPLWTILRRLFTFIMELVSMCKGEYED